MQVTGKVVVVTGGGNGIGQALCEVFHRAGAAKVIERDYYMTAQEAQEYGIVDQVFTKDNRTSVSPNTTSL